MTNSVGIGRASAYKVVLFLCFAGAILDLGLTTGNRYIDWLAISSIDPGLATLVVLHCATRALYARQPRPSRLELTATEVCLITLLCAAALTTLTSENFLNSVFGLSILIRGLFFYAIVRFALRHQLITQRDIFNAAFILWLVISAVACIQLVSDTHFGMMAGYLNSKEGGELFGRVKPTGTLQNTNLFGIWLVVLTAYLNAYLTTCGMRAVVKGTCLAIINIITVVIISYSGSRSAFIAFLVSILLLYCIKGRFDVPSILGAALFVTCAAIVLGTSQAVEELPVFMKLESIGEDDRLWLARISMQLLHYPKIFFLGTGLGSFNSGARAYGVDLNYYKWLYEGRGNFFDSKSGSHDIFLNSFTELGILGFLALVALIFSCTCTLIGILRSRSREALDAGDVFSMLAIPILLVALSLEDFTFKTPQLILLLSFVLAVLASASRRVRSGW